MVAANRYSLTLKLVNKIWVKNYLGPNYLSLRFSVERIRVEQNSGNIGLRHLDGLKLEKQKFGTVLIPNVWGFIEIRIKQKFDVCYHIQSIYQLFQLGAELK